MLFRGGRSMIVIRLMMVAVLGLLPAPVAGAAPQATAVPAPQKPVLEAFWGGAPTADQVPWEMLDTISYFFASPMGGHCSSPTGKQRADIESLAAVKKAHPDLTVLLSIGG